MSCARAELATRRLTGTESAGQSTEETSDRSLTRRRRPFGFGLTRSWVRSTLRDIRRYTKTRSLRSVRGSDVASDLGDRREVLSDETRSLLSQRQNALLAGGEADLLVRTSGDNELFDRRRHWQELEDADPVFVPRL